MALARVSDGAGDKFEAMPREFFEKVIQGYVWAVGVYAFMREIDGSGTVEEVSQRVWKAISQVLIA